MSEAELREQIVRQGICWRIADQILTLLPQYEPVQLEVLTETQINNAIADYRQILEMNGHKPTPADGRKAISFATIARNEAKGQLYRKT